MNLFGNKCLVYLFIGVKVYALMVMAEGLVMWESIEGVVAFIDFL